MNRNSLRTLQNMNAGELVAKFETSEWHRTRFLNALNSWELIRLPEKERAAIRIAHRILKEDLE